MEGIKSFQLSLEENVFILKAFKVFKFIENGVPMDNELFNPSNLREKESLLSKPQLEIEIATRNLATNSLVINNNSEKVVSINTKEYISKNSLVPFEHFSNHQENFDRVAACFNEVYARGKLQSENIISKSLYICFCNIITALCDEYETCYYSKYFIKISETLLQFKSDAELERDNTWANSASLFNENYKTSCTLKQKDAIVPKAHEKTINKNFQNKIEEDDLVIDNTNANLENNKLNNKQLNNKGFFTTPTSPSWINNFLTENDDGNNNNTSEQNNDFMVDNDYLMGENFYDKKRNSFASYKSFDDNQNPPPPSIADSASFGISHSNILMDSEAVNRIETSLLNLQNSNFFGSPENNNFLSAGDVSSKRKQKIKNSDKINESLSVEEDESSSQRNYEKYINTDTLKTVLKKTKPRKFNSSASTSNLVKDRPQYKNSIYEQQIENLKKIGNRSATLFKGQMAQQQQTYDQHQLQYESLFKNIKANNNSVQNESDFIKYDADVEQQIKEQIMSNAALNSLYDDKTNFARFNEIGPTSDHQYLNVNVNDQKTESENNYYLNSAVKENYEKLYNSPVQMRSQNGNNGSNMISSISENQEAALMNYNSFTNNNKSLPSGNGKNKFGKHNGKSNKFHFVTKKELQQKSFRTSATSPEDVTKSNGNNILNNSNYSSVMSYLNHLNSTGNRSIISSGYGVPQNYQADGFSNSTYYSSSLLVKKLEDTIAEKNKKIADLSGQMESMKDEILWLRKVVMTEVTSSKTTPSSNKAETIINTMEVTKESPIEKSNNERRVDTGENGNPDNKNPLNITNSTISRDQKTIFEKNKNESDIKFSDNDKKAVDKGKDIPKNLKKKKFKFDFKVKKGGRLAV
ncbi:hypothetical protein QEN19_002262 [Hanseniaspora menglaensis]